MPVSGTAVATALNALKRYSHRVDQAAERIASVGLFTVPDEQSQGPETATPSPVPEPTDLGGAMVDMMIAQRAFAAQLRVLKTSDEMLRDTVDLKRTQG
jgi:Flagellar basal body rod FlgEFG protein C-terminal